MKPRKPYRSPKTIQNLARQLRREMTPAERKLWLALRDRGLGGARFRRQHPVGGYIVDFICLQHKLVVEIDGDTHAGQEAYDARRTRWLREQKGYPVIRFTNEEVLANIDAVYEEIRRALQEGKELE